AMCRGTIDRNDAAPLFAADRVGHEAVAAVDVVDVHLLVLADARNIEQPPIDRAGAFVVQLGVGDGRAVDLCLEQIQLHSDDSVREIAAVCEGQVYQCGHDANTTAAER